MDAQMVHSVLILVIVFCCTIATRLLPFWIFHNKQIPKSMLLLGKILPPALIGMLLVYCFKNIDLTSQPFGLNEMLGIVLTAVIHLISKNGIIAVISGSFGYVYLVRSGIIEQLLNGV